MASKRETKTLQRGQRGFKALCARLGIREQGCRQVTHFANNSVRAVYADPSPFATLGIRTVVWTQPPGPSRGC